MKANDIKKELSLKLDLDNSDLNKLNFNRIFWEERAAKFKTKNDVSWSDVFAISLEIRNILEYIKDGKKVLDVGCSNGYSTFEIAKQRNISVQAFDYSKKSIRQAIKAQPVQDKKKRINFYHANALEIPEENGQFDIVYTIRVLINLLSWKLQKKAIMEIHRVLKPGGLYLMSEAFMGSLNNLNSLRRLADMPPLEVHEFNLYLEEKKLEKFLSSHFDIIDIKKFSSIYYVGSRFMRYLTLNNNDNDDYINPVNKFAAQFEETEHSGDFGVQKLYVLRKK